MPEGFVPWRGRRGFVFHPLLAGKGHLRRVAGGPVLHCLPGDQRKGKGGSGVTMEERSQERSGKGKRRGKGVGNRSVSCLPVQLANYVALWLSAPDMGVAGGRLAIPGHEAKAEARGADPRRCR